MKTPFEFCYDLWTTIDEEGKKHYWVRIKNTDDAVEVNHEVMKFLRAEEKKLRRLLQEKRENESLFSISSSLPGSWYEDCTGGISEIEFSILEEEFRTMLTDNQLALYEECIIGPKPVSQYAMEHGIRQQSAFNTITWIRKKAKKYFFD